MIEEPPVDGVWAIRYINDQEKILRRPGQVTAVAAEVVPRRNDYPADRGPEMFSAETWWSHERRWKFIGVPYAVVEIAMEETGQTLRSNPVSELATILPKG